MKEPGKIILYVVRFTNKRQKIEEAKSHYPNE